MKTLLLICTFGLAFLVGSVSAQKGVDAAKFAQFRADLSAFENNMNQSNWQNAQDQKLALAQKLSNEADVNKMTFREIVVAAQQGAKTKPVSEGEAEDIRLNQKPEAAPAIDPMSAQKARNNRESTILSELGRLTVTDLATAKTVQTLLNELISLLETDSLELPKLKS